MNSFYPDKIVQDTAYSPVVITDIKVHNVSVRTYPLSIRKGIVANRAIDFIDKIVLGYRENNFSLDFSILNYINPELNRYLYRLEGYDKEWLSVEAGRRFAYYNNLPQVLILLCKGSQSEWNLVSGYEMSAYNYSSAALVIVVGLLPLCLVVRFIGMVYLSDCQKPYPDETGHRDGEDRTAENGGNQSC